MKFHISIEEAIQQLEKEKQNRFTTVMKHRTMSVEYYAPENIDPQTPHKQGEIYIIASGDAIFFEMAKEWNAKPVMFYLFLLKWNIASKIFLMISPPG